MCFLALFLMAPPDDPADALAKKMLPIYVKEVEAYSLAVEAAPKKALELKKEPVFEWSNLLAEVANVCIDAAIERRELSSQHVAS